MGLTINDLKYTVSWNLFLLTVGSLIFVVGMNGIVIHQNFIPGGLYGLVLFIHYQTGLLSTGIWYLLLNIPLAILGWIFVSKRFVLYTVYAIGVITLASDIIHLNFNIHNQLYAAIAAGSISGIGSGIILRSIGSAGGLDIIAIILLNKLNIGVGKTFMIFNLILFSLVVYKYNMDIVIASLILTFVTTRALDYALTMFNQRKIVYIISDMSQEIAEDIRDRLKMGATFIQARGLYSGSDKEIIMTITNNIALKRLEEAVFTLDDNAVFIVENSYDVIGSSFKKRKIY